MCAYFLNIETINVDFINGSIEFNGSAIISIVITIKLF